MKEVIAIIRPGRWPQTKARLQQLHLPACTQQRVLGRGRERGLRYLSRKGAAAGTGVQYLPKRMISWIVDEAQVEPLIQALIDVNRTGQVGDGRVFVLPIEDAIRIRTGQRGAEAVRTEGDGEVVWGTPHASSTVELEHASRQ